MLVASLLFHAFALPHGYWVALTALVVLRPDFASTMSRGVARVVGTALGALIATVVAAETRPAASVLVVLITLCAFVGYVIFRANQAIFSTFLTGYVVFLLALVGLPGRQAAFDRLLDTAIGGALALVAYAVWPTWEAGRVRERLATLVSTQVDYACEVLEGVRVQRARGPPAGWRAPRPTPAGPGRVPRPRSSASPSSPACAARPRTTCSTSRSPRASSRPPSATPRRCSRCTPACPAPAGRSFRRSHAFVTELRRAGAALERRGARRPGPATFPALRTAQLQLAAELGDATLHRRLVALETDIVVDALDTMAHLVHLTP